MVFTLTQLEQLANKRYPEPNLQMLKHSFFKIHFNIIFAFTLKFPDGTFLRIFRPNV
jgi:hypothetical protein